MYGEPGDMYVQGLKVAENPWHEEAQGPCPACVSCVLCHQAQVGLWFRPVLNGGRTQGDCRCHLPLWVTKHAILTWMSTLQRESGVSRCLSRELCNMWAYPRGHITHLRMPWKWHRWWCIVLEFILKAAKLLI